MERFAIKIDKKLKANLYKICRLCGIDNPEMVPILTGDEGNANVAEAMDVDAEPEMPQKIKLLIGLMVTKDDRMPQTMCSLCVDKINDFYEFREMCYATNTQTRKLLGLKNIKKPVPDIKPKVEVKEEQPIIPKTTGKGLKSILLNSTKIPINAKGFKSGISPATTAKLLGRESRKRKLEEPEEILGRESRKRKQEEPTPLPPATIPKKEPVMSKKEPAMPKKEPAILAANNKKPLLPPAMPKKEQAPAAVGNKKSLLPPPMSKKEQVPPAASNKKPLLPPPMPKKEQPLPAVSNKKLRLAAATLKEAATKKAKQKNKEESKDVEVKDEIKEEPKEEKPPPPPPPPVTATTSTTAPQANNKLKQACTICSERFATKAKLEAHTRLQHIPKIERYVCTACNETISKSFDIKNHQLWHKLSKTPYICGLCGESIVSTYAYARHVREHCFETPAAFLVLDRECPQCHVSYATNYLYNTHPCAVKAKRCAGCNRLQRSDTEFIKHSALCAKVYLNYSKHIMPAVEAQEDEVRIKNENDVEAAAEEMARITGMPLDMAPVVQLTRLTSPLIMAANQCVSIPGIEDSPSTSSKKTGKKGVSKKELKRVDELLKSTLDALVSIKHEPEVHVDTEPPPAGGEQSDHGGHSSDETPNMDVGFQEDDSDNDDSAKATQSTDVVAANADEVAIKQEVDATLEAPKPEDGENANKLSSGGGLKLKIRKEHGQLNSSIIEQQKSVEKRAEKRKKKKKHKDKVKDKLKLQKEQQEQPEEQNSLDSFNTQHNEDNISSAESPAAVRIKAEPVDEIDIDASAAVAAAQGRPQPEATIMTSIPMMQLQIACISEGVDFNGSNATTAVEDPQINHVPAVEVPKALVTTPTKATVHEDVKPNREELDRMLKISHVSSGIAMETDETESELQLQHDDATEHDNQSRNDEEDDKQRHEDEDGEGKDKDDEEDEEKDEENDEEKEEDKDVDEDEDQDEKEQNIEEDADVSAPMETPTSENKHSDDEEKQQQQTSKHSKPIKSKLIKHKPAPKIIAVKSRNKACKSTAKPSVPFPKTPVLQISSVQSGVTLSLSTESAQNEFAPVFIKPEPQNRGYSDERPAPTPSPPLPSSSPSSPAMSHNESDEIAPALQEQHQLDNEEDDHQMNNEEQAYISSIDFNNITIKQEKDLDINDVQITANKARYCKYSLNGIRKRKAVRRVQKKRESCGDDDDHEEPVEKTNDDMAVDDVGAEEEEMEEDASEEEDEGQDEDEPMDDEDAEEEEDDEEEEDEEEEEEREYRELEYPPELKTQELEPDKETEDKSNTEAKIPNNIGAEQVETKNYSVNDCPGQNPSNTNNSVPSCEQDKIVTNESHPIAIPAFVISSVCSHASDFVDPTERTETSAILSPHAFIESRDDCEVTTTIKTAQDSLLTTSEQTDIQNLQLLKQKEEPDDTYGVSEQEFEPKSPVLKIASITSGSMIPDLQHPTHQYAMQQETQIGVNNVENVVESELENLETLSHNIVQDQCEVTHVSQVAQIGVNNVDTVVESEVENLETLSHNIVRDQSEVANVSQENQIGGNNVDNVVLSELENLDTLSQNTDHDQCGVENVSQEAVVESNLNALMKGSEPELILLGEFDNPVAAGSGVINHDSEGEQLLSKIDTPGEAEIIQREIYHDQIELNTSDGTAIETVRDENVHSYHESTVNTVSTQIVAVEPSTETFNLQHQSEIPAESDFTAQTMPSEISGALQGQSTTSAGLSDAGEYTSQGCDITMAEVHVSTAQNTADDQGFTNVAPEQYQQETPPVTQFEEKSCVVLIESGTSVNHDLANVATAREVHGQECIPNILDATTSEVSTVQTANAAEVAPIEIATATEVSTIETATAAEVSTIETATSAEVSAIESATTSMSCVSHNNDDVVQSASLEYTKSETMEGIIVQTNDLELKAKPIAHSCANQEEETEMDVDEEEDEDEDEVEDEVENEDDDYEEDNYEDEAEEEGEEDEDAENEEDNDKTDHETETLVDSNLNLEEQQNQLNQQQQQETLSELARPTALALHPYLEDISSSSNSFLSNTLSQTPPPTQSTSNNGMAQPAPSHHSEETENVLNESSDVLSRRASFNFDNINEIAENNNNANLEREQLQDDQQQHNDVT